MNDNRQYPRYSCSLKTRFRHYSGDPDTIDLESSPSSKGKGKALDISRGGIYIATDSLVSVNVPVVVEFKTKKRNYSLKGSIVRTGKIEENPSAQARIFSLIRPGKKYYIAIRFTEPLETLDESELA